MKKYIFFAICLLIPCFSVFSQKTVKGVVIDINNLPVPGVNVTVKESTKGTISDIEGHFSIPEVNNSDVLVFSFLGFKTAEVAVGTQSSIDVILEVDNVNLDEFVAVGYGTSRKKDLTGAIAQISSADLAKTATANFDQAMAGRVAGVQVTSTDGTPGEAANIVIRGGNSITGDNSPLYVVDGIPMEDFDPASISTQDIKSFDILKDASATAIYGARGANGVIVITTNGGRSDGRTDVKLHVFTGLQTVMNRIEVMSPYEYAKFQKNVAYANDNYIPSQNVRGFETSWLDPELYRDVEGTNWQDEILQTALMQDYNLSISGGNKQSTFYYSGSYLDQEGTLITTGFNKLNNRLKLTHKINDKIAITTQLTYDHYIRKGLQVTPDSRSSVIRDAITFRPVNPINWTGDDEEYFVDQDPYLYDPVKTLNNTDRKRIDEAIAGYLSAKYKIMPKLTLDVKGSYWRNIRKESIFYGLDTQKGTRTDAGIQSTIWHRRYQTLTTSNTLQYKDKIGKHRYGALLGVEAQSRFNEYSDMSNTNIPTDIFGISNISIGTVATLANSSETANNLLSYFSRVNYNYNDRYLVTANFRADGSSKFAEGNRWGYFPSFSAAWRLSQESFAKNVDIISNLKLRAGWGLTGNNRIGDFDAYNLVSVNSGSGYVLGKDQSYTPGAYQSNMAVPDLRWETTAQTNIGLDFGLLQQRINGTVDVYYKKTKDLLLDAEMALHSGFDKVQQNVGSIQNKGVEFTINTANIEHNNFSWHSTFNISFNRTKTLNLNSGQTEILIDPEWDAQFTQTEYQYITQVGQPVGMIYGLEYDGLYQLSNFTLVNSDTYQLNEGEATYRPIMQPGMVKFKDQNGDNIINENDRVIIGNPHPTHFGGITNNLRYKNFDLQVFFQWAVGFDILNANKAEFGTFNKTRRNGLASLADVWMPDNTDTDVSGIRYGTVNLSIPFGYKVDDRFVDDGSYLKLKTLVLGYNLPKSVLRKMNIKKCRFTVSAQNLYTWTGYQGYNPDVSVGKYGALTPSLDYSSYPQSLTISGGLDITF